jgi:nucleoside-diphosphate-sugar epimerase
VVVVHPGTVIGPHDPYFGESAVLLAWVARGRMTVFPTGGMHVTDVRDVADVVVAALEPGGRPRRYVVPGHHVRGPELFAAVGEAVGRRRRHVPAPPRVVAMLMRAAAPAWRLLPAGASSPMTPDGPTIVGRDTVLDTSPAERELDVHARPFAASVRDTIGWMVDTGHLPEKYRPAAASVPR